MYSELFDYPHMYDFFDKNYADERDIVYLKNLYSGTVRQIQTIIEDECDKMEYNGSMMFDEYPDKLMLRMKCKNICDRVNDSNGGVCPCGDERWMEDTVAVMLYNEMYRRRCRRRKRFYSL